MTKKSLPDDKVSEESCEEADVKVSRIEDNPSVNNGHCQLNPANDVHSSVLVDKDKGHQMSQSGLW